MSRILGGFRASFAFWAALWALGLCPAKAMSRQHTTGQRTPVACKELTTMRSLGSRLEIAKNTKTNDQIEYLVVGDGAKSNLVLVFFNGTSQIIPDWPTQMITNAERSPLIRKTPIFEAVQDGSISLCHDYRLVFFDYPGVGSSPDGVGVTLDNIASDVNTMLEDVGQKFKISTNDVTVIGWSLGTVMALKYTMLSPAGNPSRTIHDVILFGTKPGGGKSSQTNGNGAPCVQNTFSGLTTSSISRRFRAKLEKSNYKLLYPYVGQQTYNGPDSGCTVVLDQKTDTVTVNVKPTDCSAKTLCGKVGLEWAANRHAHPWSITNGVDNNVFTNQRKQNADWNYSYCPSAGPDFHSTGCTSSQAPELSATDGGVCQTTSPASLPNQPVSTDCAALTIKGRITVVDGEEDLYIQYLYGAALVTAYQKKDGPQKAAIITYPGSDGAGHGLLLQHPGWAQAQIAGSLTSTAP